MAKITIDAGINRIVESKYQLITTLEIIGHPPRKSNSRRIIKTKAGHPLLIRSQGALDYETSFLLQAKLQYRGDPVGALKEHIRLDAVVYYRSRQADLSVELVMDCLEKAGIVANDRYITEQHLYGFVDSENPRICIMLYKILGDRKPPF